MTNILREATAAIEPEYFLLPLHGAAPVYRERVYCYELYHQIRSRWPKECPLRINGEIDKQAHPYFQNDGAPKPDLLIHEPGTGNNYAVIEVKSSRAVIGGIRKDIATLSLFTQELGYRHAIYLIYGEHSDGLANSILKQDQHNLSIELWIHPQAGNSAFRMY